MPVKQYKHHPKPGGKQTLRVGKWVAVAGLGTWTSSGAGHMKAELYLNINYTDDPAFPGGGVIEARVVRKAWRGKWREPDPCGADTRALPRGLKQTFARMKVNEPIRTGEIGRSYYWQVRVRGVRSCYLTTRYDDFWRIQ